MKKKVISLLVLFTVVFALGLFSAYAQSTQGLCNKYSAYQASFEKGMNQYCNVQYKKEACKDYTDAVTKNKELVNVYCKDVASSDETAIPKTGMAYGKTCTDSDGGKNYKVAGDAKGYDGKGTVDACDFSNDVKGIIWEAVCEKGVAVHYKTPCPKDTPYCNRAVCSKEPGKCEDTDGGNIPELLGTVTEIRTADGPQATDYCEDLSTLQPLQECTGEQCGVREYYCAEENKAPFQDVDCPNGCNGGVCQPQELAIYNINPTGVYLADSLPAYLKIQFQTKRGADNGRAICLYNSSNQSYTLMLYTNDTWHAQHLELSEEEEYIFNIKCVDSAGQTATAIISFELRLSQCTDSDSGKNYFEKGVVTLRASDETFTDTCEGNLLMEGTCDEWGGKVYEVNCPNGCQDGACIKETLNCTDSDGGKNYNVKGTATDSQSSKTDYCLEGGETVAEYFCKPYKQVVGYVEHGCADICQDGVCVREEMCDYLRVKLAANQVLASVKPVLTKADLPLLLRSGVILSQSGISRYTQELVFYEAEYKSNIENAQGEQGNFLYIKNNAALATYILKFKTPAVSIINGSSLDNFIRRKLHILGRRYLIKNATYSVQDGLKLVLGYDSARVVLSDNNLADSLGKNILEVDNVPMGNALVTISGFANKTAVSISMITIDVKTGGDYYAKPGYKLSEYMAEPKALLGSWDIRLLNPVGDAAFVEIGRLCPLSAAPCADSDAGENYSVKGESSYVKSELEELPVWWVDVCLSDYPRYEQGQYIPPEGITKRNGLLEGRCNVDPNEAGTILAYECPDGCKEGACVIKGADKENETKEKETNKNNAQKKKIGFRNAFWSCFDGQESSQGGPDSCKGQRTWEKYAREACKGHCGNKKCGVNTFSISEECDITESAKVSKTGMAYSVYAKGLCEKYSSYLASYRKGMSQYCNINYKQEACEDYTSVVGQYEELVEVYCEE